MDVCLWVLKESNKSKFDGYSVRNSVLIISHVTFWYCRVHIFPTTFLEIAACSTPHREPTLLLVNWKWKLNKRQNLTCFVLSPNLLWCEVKWKLFYDAKTMFNSTLWPLLISQGFMWFGSHFTIGITRPGHAPVVIIVSRFIVGY